MLLDTSGLLCYLHRDEPQHADAVVLFDASESMLVHNYVIAELIALAGARRLPRDTVLCFAEDLLNHPDVEVVWVGETLHHAAMQLLAAQLDKTYSLSDAVSFLLMRERGMTDALTTDRHFQQAGFKRLLKPQ